MATGLHHTVMLRTDGTVAVSGSNLFGELGVGSAERDLGRGSAVVVPGLDRIAVVAAGWSHTLALAEDGSVVAWGDNGCGQLGDGTTTDRRSPVAIPGLEQGVTAVAAHFNTSLALREDGVVLAWGWNHEGALGYGGTDNELGLPQDKRLVPAEITGLDGPITAIAPQAALRADGTVVAWGGEYPNKRWGADATLPVGVTKLGGRPDLPHRTRWLRVQRRPLCFVAQVDLAALPAEHAGGGLSEAGLLSFFCGDTDDFQPGVVLYTEPGVALRRVDFPSALSADVRFAPRVLQPTSHVSLVSPESALLQPLGLSPADEDAYQNLYHDLLDQQAPLHRLLGHPDAVQPGLPDGDGGPVMLLQVDTDDDVGMVWGDAGRLYYWITPDDLAGRRFDRSWLDFQSH